MNNVKGTVELNEEVYAKSKEAHTIALQKLNKDYYTKNLKGDCKTMYDAFDRFINIDFPISFQNRNSENYFKLNGNKFKMHKFIHPTECISNFGEIEYKIEKELSLKISIQLKSESESWFNNYFHFELKEVVPTGFVL